MSCIMCGNSCGDHMFCSQLCTRNYRQGTPFIWTSWKVPFSDGLEFVDSLRQNRGMEKTRIWKI